MADRRGPPTVSLPEALPAGVRDDHTIDLSAEGDDERGINGRTHALTPSGHTHLQGGRSRTIHGPAGSTAAGPPRGGGGRGEPHEGSLGRLLPDRYEDLGSIDSGGFGDVRRVRDKILHRTLAMKVLRAEFVDNAHLRARFLTEARITAQLQHPGIVAVHDHGVLPDGRLWFTMKEVRGRTLRAVIDEVHNAASADGFVEAPSGWTFRRLLDAFARISQAVAFAHSEGVMHRDLKPDNLMVGEFGEVLVMDWGLARRVDNEGDSLAGLISVDLPDEVPGPSLAGGGAGEPGGFPSPDGITQYGDVLGTPAYMPPEQAQGRRELHGTHSDVYALGAILYHLLSGRPPYVGTQHGVIRMVIAGPPPPLARVLQVRPPVPDELVVICERAMARDIASRYPGAAPLSEDILAFLEGARRREQALGILQQAHAIEPELAALRARAAQARAEAEHLLGDVRPSDPIEKKRPAWALEDEAAALGRAAALRETEWLQTVHGALTVHPELPEAHAVLADHYREQLSAAELAHADEDAARFEAQLRAHDRGRHAAFLRGEGALSLVTDPPGAEVRLERFVLDDRRLVAEDAGTLGTTPLRAVPLQRGSYRLRLRAPGHHEVLYPVLIDRGGHWDGCPPGERDPFPVVLPRDGELGPDECYVPAGWCWTGGDRFATDSLPQRRLWIDAFVLARYPVTNREYLEFLNALLAEGREEEALAACPRNLLDNASERLAFGRGDDGLFVLIADELGRPTLPDWPVTLVDWYGARDFAAWRAAKTGRAFRLPTELEREKAARGTDGRLFPWGDAEEATFACTNDSRDAEPIRTSIHDYPLDESPYGIRGLAGDSRDWCANVWRRQGPEVSGGRIVLPSPTDETAELRAARGGAWNSTLSFSRSACRFGGRPTLRRMTLGARLARSL